MDKKDELLISAYKDITTKVRLANKSGQTLIEYMFSDEMEQKDIDFMIRYFGGKHRLKISKFHDDMYLIDWKHLSLKVGDMVKYIGAAHPKFTNRVYEIIRVVSTGFLLFIPLDERSDVVLKDGTIWGTNYFYSRFDEVEVSE